VEVTDQQGQVRHAPLMSLLVGLVDGGAAEFSDIREITEVAAEARRLQRQA
jgi:hypothetical protein